MSSLGTGRLNTSLLGQARVKIYNSEEERDAEHAEMQKQEKRF